LFSEVGREILTVNEMLLDISVTKVKYIKYKTQTLPHYFTTRMVKANNPSLTRNVFLN